MARMKATDDESKIVRLSRPGQDSPVESTGGSLTETLRRRLEVEILDGQLEPGSRLDEQEVAQRFGVSRTPVREAFRLLAADDLVQLRGRLGVVVRSLDVTTLLEMFQVMAELEGLCARLAARRIAPPQLQALQRIHERLCASTNMNPDDFYAINQEFHEVIYEAANNAYLADQTRRLRNRVGFYRRRVTHLSGRVESTLHEHGAVLDALVARDPERADALMQTHLNLLGDNLLDFIATFQ
jgi:DNA-binding GntR family transcriptional regulator